MSALANLYKQTKRWFPSPGNKTSSGSIREAGGGTARDMYLFLSSENSAFGNYSRMIGSLQRATGVRNDRVNVHHPNTNGTQQPNVASELLQVWVEAIRGAFDTRHFTTQRRNEDRVG